MCLPVLIVVIVKPSLPKYFIKNPKFYLRSFSLLKTWIKNVNLKNSLTVQIFDTTRRYYEDYHLVRLEIECDVPLRDDFFKSTEEFTKALALLGDSAQYRRTVEKMGVPFAGIDAARDDLISCFIATSLPYMEKESFPLKFVLSEMCKESGKMLRSVV